MQIGDGAGLKDSIIAMIHNQEECIAMGDRAKRLYKRKYAYEVAMRKYKDMLNKALQ